MMTIDSDARSARKKRPRVGITLGDPNGIGPEITLKCLADSRIHKFMQAVVIGSAHVLAIHAKRLGFEHLRILPASTLPEVFPEDAIVVLDIAPETRPSVVFGKITAEGGLLAMRAVEAAVDLCHQARLDAMVTAPISKEAIAKADYDTPGHTEFIAARVGATSHNMMMVADGMRVGLVTAHIPLADVSRRITEAAIIDKIGTLHSSLIQDFGIQRPRIAVLGLNPHAGDGGVLGHEEQTIITPAIRSACQRGFHVFGPYAPDGFFAKAGYRNYDAVLAMYHDQGLIPFKTIAFETGVNFTAGLPIVRTSPDHGTAYDIAGKGLASPNSMRSAIYLAIDVARRRLDQPLATSI